MRHRPASSFGHRARQRGIVLIVALIVMVATILAAVALISSVDVATLISGNLAFRQSGVQKADAGVEAARTWLMSKSDDYLHNLHADAPFYYPCWDGNGTANDCILAKAPLGPTDASVFTWSTANSYTLPGGPDAAGNTVAYVVHRMCDRAGDENNDLTVNCYRAVTTGSVEGNSNRVDCNRELLLCASGTQVQNPYYRITVKVTGPRSTVTYVQAVIY